SVGLIALCSLLILFLEPEEFVPRIFWLDLATHGFNSCIAACELLVSRTPVRALHVYQPLGLGLNGNPFIYEVLDWRQGRRAGIIVVGSVAGLLILYAILWGVALCRD
ncbi:Protein rolling stone, partial [Operophtera brumata]